MTPTVNASSRPNNRANAQAVTGMMVNCATQPMAMSLGRLNTTLKSSSLVASPMPNMTTPNKTLISVPGTKNADAAICKTLPRCQNSVISAKEANSRPPCSFKPVKRQ